MSSKLDKIAEEYAKFQHQEEYNDPVFAPDVFETKRHFKSGIKEGVNLIDWDKIRENFNEIINIERYYTSDELHNKYNKNSGYDSNPQLIIDFFKKQVETQIKSL